MTLKLIKGGEMKTELIPGSLLLDFIEEIQHPTSEVQIRFEQHDGTFWIKAYVNGEMVAATTFRDENGNVIGMK